MNRKLLLLFGLVLFLPIFTYLVYQKLSWEPLPPFRLEKRTTGVGDTAWAAAIAEASARLTEAANALQVPSLSVAVGVDGELVWCEALGYADLDQGIAATPTTAYRIGSTSKAITSVAAMLLVQEGRWDLDRPVAEYLPGFPPKRWDFSTRQLLSHTAGIVDYEDLNVSGIFYTLLNFKHFGSVEEGLAVFQGLPLLYEPGTRFKYNSFDVVLASRVLERVSGRSYLDYLRDELFQPLGMTNSYGDHGPYGGGQEAVFYQLDGKGRFRAWHTFGFPRNEVNLSYKWAGGGLLSTPADLVRMGNALLRDSTFVGFPVRDTFFTPQKLANGEINEQRYALGWRSDKNYSSEYLLGEDRPVWIVHHGGVSKGSMNLLCLFPVEGIVIDAVINGREEDFEFAPFWDAVMRMGQPFLKVAAGD